MGLQFIKEIEQHRDLSGQLLPHLTPWQCDPIEKDGNCFFRCISQIISGTQAHHQQLRGEVCRFIATDGREFTQKYLRTKFYKETSSLAYLRQSAMTQSGIWATDVEIVNVAKMFSTDVFVATKQHSPEHQWRRIDWLRYSGCDSTKSLGIYITNYDNHFDLLQG